MKGAGIVVSLRLQHLAQPLSAEARDGNPLGRTGRSSSTVEPGDNASGNHRVCVYPVHVGGRRPASPVLQLRACRGQPSKGALSRGQRSQGGPSFRGADTFDHLPDRLDHKLRLILVNIVTTLGCNEKARIWNEGGKVLVRC